MRLGIPLYMGTVTFRAVVSLNKKDIRLEEASHQDIPQSSFSYLASRVS
jgi:hypothetical protein